jgi:uncharacterized protein (TIGR00369 family)
MTTTPDPRFVEVWHRTTAAEFIRAIAAGDLPGTPHAEHVGMRVVACEPGRVELAWDPPSHLCNPAGMVHGGYASLVLDDAAGLAAASLGERFAPILTAELRIDYLRPIYPDRLVTAVGTVVHAGRSRTIADGQILDADGRLLTRATGTFVPNRSYRAADDPRSR